jgi:hypothetical protein
MMDFPLFDFIIASLLMGLGIGADVVVATVARAGQLSTARLAMVWVVGVSLTHTLFPMLGYLLTYYSIQMLPELEPVIGLIAFACIFFYLKHELEELSRPKIPSEDRQLMLTLGLILAVSWDALWSGPAKSAQIIGWPEFFVWGSFVVVGAFVSLLAIVSLTFALRVKQSLQQTRLSQWFAHWVQYSVIGYFGLLALLRYTLAVDIYWWQVLILSAVLIALVMTKVILQASNSSSVKN